MLVSNEIERLRIEEFDNIGKVEFSTLIGSNPATYSHIINEKRLPSKKFLYNLSLATKTDYVKWLELLEKDRMELNKFKKNIHKDDMLFTLYKGNMLQALMKEESLRSNITSQNFEEFAEEYLSEAPKKEVVKELAKKQDDTCKDTIEMLINIKKITNPEDVYNDPTVKDMILSAAKFEIEEILNKKALEK